MKLIPRFRVEEVTRVALVLYSPVVFMAWAVDPAESTPADKLKVWAAVGLQADIPIPQNARFPGGPNNNGDRVNADLIFALDADEEEGTKDYSEDDLSDIETEQSGEDGNRDSQ